MFVGQWLPDSAKECVEPVFDCTDRTLVSPFATDVIPPIEPRLSFRGDCGSIPGKASPPSDAALPGYEAGEAAKACIKGNLRF